MRAILTQHGNELRLNLLGSMDTKIEACEPWSSTTTA